MSTIGSVGGGSPGTNLLSIWTIEQRGYWTAVFDVSQGDVPAGHPGERQDHPTRREQ